MQLEEICSLFSLKKNNIQIKYVYIRAKMTIFTATI